MRKAAIAVGVIFSLLLAWFVLSVTGVFARDITGRTWVLAASEHDGIRPPQGFQGERPSFRLADLKLSYDDGCNSGDGWAVLLSGTLYMSPTASSQVGCLDTTTVPADAFDKKPQLIHHGTWLELRHGEKRWAFEESQRSTPS